MHLYQIDFIIEQGVSECLNFYTVYDTIHKFLNKMFKSFVGLFGSWCIIASFYIGNKMASVIIGNSNISQIRLRFLDFQLFWKPLES